MYRKIFLSQKFITYFVHFHKNSKTIASGLEYFYKVWYNYKRNL